MNTSSDDDTNSLRYAEYALGVLDADERAAIEREVATHDEAALAVTRWEQRLMPLSDGLPEVPPSPDVWLRIRQRLEWDLPRARAQRIGFWDSVRLWRSIAAGAAVVSAVCVAIILRSPVRETRQVGHGAVMVASLLENNGMADWTAAMDLDRKQIVVVPAAAATIPQGRSTQLWLIPAGQAPISVGVFKFDIPTALPLEPALLTKLGPTATLAVSVEPPGGSPTGQPTGPVIAKGAISMAPPVSGAG